MLKKIRITLAIIITGLLSFFFLDYMQLLPRELHFLAHIQFVEAYFTMLSGHFQAMLFLVVLTLLFGRIYCSVICPLGVFQDFIFWLHKRINKKKWLKYAKPLSLVRYTFLGIMIISMATGIGLIVELLAPYASFGRILTHLGRPIVLYVNNLLAMFFEYTGDYYLIETEIAIISMFSFVTALVSFIVVSVLSWTNGRTFCNSICPVGTVLGLISHISLFKIQIDKEKCGSCGLCERNCKAKCINSKEKTIDYSRCVDCFNCLKTCKKDAMTFSKTSKNKSKSKITETQVSTPLRRDFVLKLSALAAGTIAFPKLFTISAKATNATTNSTSNIAQNSLNAGNSNSQLSRRIAITPPGSLGHDNFTQKCTSCHLCITKCPTKVLKPAKLEYGISGIMQPTLKYNEGYCLFDCDICAAVCPATAINAFHDMKDKQNTQIGIAQYHADKCQVNTMNVKCGLCSENCPAKAITLVPKPSLQNIVEDNADTVEQPENTSNGALAAELLVPVINKELCIGCGACEYFCPTLADNKAIWVQGNKIHKNG